MDSEQEYVTLFPVPSRDGGVHPLCASVSYLHPSTDPGELKGSWLPPHFPLLGIWVSLASFAHEALEEGVLEQPGRTRDPPGPLGGGAHWFRTEEVVVIAIISLRGCQ